MLLTKGPFRVRISSKDGQDGGQQSGAGGAHGQRARAPGRGGGEEPAGGGGEAPRQVASLCIFIQEKFMSFLEYSVRL